MIVIGTAGHIDHGKSSLVRRLTGTDPDRLPEEKKRGMTIDLGFAFCQSAQSEAIAFVDVPGHERFVKNMISGASGIDAVMLVVAADDGWMPQTEEHFQIVRLLGIRSGFIVLNKCDLSDKPQINRLRAEIKERVRGSFLSKAPIYEVSSLNGDGYDALKEYLNTLNVTLTAGRDIGKARLYIDRVFVQPGIGEIATGTLKDGAFSVGQAVSVWPTLAKGKIRTLQSNGQDVDRAVPSQRTALSLTGIAKNELVRGGAILANQDLTFFKDNPVLVLRVELLKESKVILKNRRRVLLLLGTSEMEGEVRLYEKDILKPGESGIVFFKPDQALLSLVGDNFVLRLPTPMVTLGGGAVLDHLQYLPGTKNMAKLSYLPNRDVGNIEQLIISELQKLAAVRRDQLLINSFWSQAEINRHLEQLIQKNQCGEQKGLVYEKQTMAAAMGEVLDTIKSSLIVKGGIRGLALKEIAAACALPGEVVKVVLQELEKAEKIKIEDELYTLARLDSTLPAPVQRAYNDIVEKLKSSPFTPPAIEALASKGQTYKDAIGQLLKTGEAHKCGAEFLFLNSAWNEIESYIRKTLENQKELKVGELKNRFGFSRKYAVPILEETDRIKLTRRQDDVRVRGDKFES